jgi:prepilin signal peptidase PulO-like enzyme (type II secretory pathway)
MENFSQLNSQNEIFLVAIFALIFGSFASLLSHRLASKEPIVFTRSKCLNCGTVLKILNLIPLFSWIFQRGKCGKCHAKISLRYPLIELSFLISFVTIYFALNQEINWKMLLYFLIAGTLIVMCVVDLEQYFIPDSTQYFLVTLATLLLIVKGGTETVITNIPAAFLYAGFGLALWVFFYFTAKLEAIGIDDIKFFFIIGFLLGTKNFLAFMMLSGILGLIFGALWQKFKKDETFPFAPAICLSAFICLLFDQKINPIELLGSLIF